jgi:hypothetical protein
MTAANTNTPPGFLRTLTVTVIVIGGIISNGFTLHAGHHNRSVFLIILFLGWVSSPFIGLLLACFLSNLWPVVTRKVLYIGMILMVICSVVGYSGVFSPSGTKPAFVFLVIPLISWILIAIAIPVVISQARKKKNLH